MSENSTSKTMSGKGTIPGANFSDGDKRKALGSFKIPKKDAGRDSTRASSAAGSSGTHPNKWQTVGKKKGRYDNVSKGRVTASAGIPTTPGGRETASAGTPQIPPHIRELWARENRCFRCGSESHHKSSCPLGAKASANAARSNSATNKVPLKRGAQAQKPSSKEDQRGVKRSHDPGPSGTTPPAKRTASTKKHCYAAAAAGALEVAIVTKDMGHISKRDFEKIRMLVEDAWLEQLEKGEEPFEVEQWLYTSQMATFSVPSERSGLPIERIIKEQGFSIISKMQLLEKRRPTTIITGLVTGSAASRERTILERLIKFEAERVGVIGRLEFYAAHLVQKSGNLLLKLIADDRAMACLKELDFELRIGASGRVKFTDERAEKKTSAAEKKMAKVEELEKSIEEHKKMLKDMLQQRRALEGDEESVGSIGVSNLSMETDDKEPGEKEKATADEDA